VKRTEEKRDFKGEWRELETIPRRLPIDKFPFRLTQLKGELYTLGNNAYAAVRGMPPEATNDGLPESVQRVVILFWACDDRAAIAIEDGVGYKPSQGLPARDRTEPPACLLPNEASSWRLKDIYRAARAQRVGVPICGLFSLTGFRARVVNLRRPWAEVYYPSPKNFPLELPYAIVLIQPVLSKSATC
jgi:hypothetical protein